MQINKLILRNIGAYYGELNKFTFETTPRKNVILLGGKNGAGKTTILESLRIVLFGSMAYGYITENEPYFSKIYSLLNRKALQSNEKNFQISLEYTSIEEFKSNIYSLIRSWTIKNQKIREHFSVKKNGEHLNAQQIADFQNKLREEMPPRLFELCLFDGEDISRIVSEYRIPEYLRESGKILFNLDLFINLEKDLKTYQLQYAQKNAEASKEIAEQNILESEITKIKQELEEKRHINTTNEEEIISLNHLIRQDKKDFETHGGLIQERRQELISKINQIENHRKANSDKIRTFVGSLLPFHITLRQLEKVDRQLSLEKEHESYEFVALSLNRNKLEQLILTIQKEMSPTLSNLIVDPLHKGILEIMRPEDIQLIHRASFTQRSEIHNLLLHLNEIDVSSYIDHFQENSKLLDESQELRKAVEKNDQSSEFKDLLMDIESKTKRVEQLKLLIEQQTNELHLLNESLQLKIASSDKITEKIREYHIAENSYVMTEKLLNVSQRFRERQWRKKLDDVANEATKMIEIIFRKKNYINQVYIDHISFELHLYNKDKQELNKERLSAGEKEMLMLTVIWAMFKVSNWKLPFVFDTLFGRLDQEHKRTLIEKFIPKCGDQVLLFTTDSEISQEQFELIKDITAACYTLEFNDSTESANIVPDRYFNMSREKSLQ